MAKDRTPEKARPTGAGKGGNGSRAAGGARGKSGRTRPVNTVVAQQRPWGLIAGALAVLVFAAAVITYAVVKVNEANEGKVEAVSDIAGIEEYDYAAGQQHVTTPVEYTESPPIGGEHDLQWADCTGTVYDVDIRHENAVHSLEHGAVWITYDPDALSEDEIATLADLVEGTSGLMLSPYEGQSSPISLQSWNHQLSVDSVTDERIQQYTDFMTFNDDFYPEVGASCENPTFISDPLVVGDASRATGDTAVPTDAPTSPTSAAGSSTPAP